MSIKILKIKFEILSFLARYLLSLAVFIILFLPVALTLANHYWGNYPNQGILWMSGEKGYNGHVWVTSTHCFSEETSAYMRIKESTTGTYEMSRWLNGIQMVPITCDGDIDNNPSIDIKLDYQENYQNDPEHGTEGGHNHSTLALPGYCAAWNASYPCGTRSTVHLNKPNWDTKSFTWRERLIMHETGHSHRLDHHCNSDSIMNDGYKSCNKGKWEQIMAYQPTDRTGINSIYSTYVSGIISQNTTWKRAYSPYIVQSTITVNSGVTLTIEAGVVVKFQSATASLVVNGTLQVNGTSATNVYFTSLKDDSVGGDTNGDGSASLPAAQNWQYIQFNSGSTGNISNAVVRYAGYSYGNGIYNNGGTLNISNSQIADNSSNGISQTSGASTITFTEFNNQNYGVYATDGALTLNNNAFNNNSSAVAYIAGSVNFIHSGNTAAGTGLRGFVTTGNVSADRTWTSDYIPYVISNLTVDAGKTLTIDPGAIVKFQCLSCLLTVNGTLNAQGTSANKITFTSIKDDAVGGDTNGDGIATSPAPKDWTYIKFNLGSQGTLSYAAIKYAGYSNSNRGIFNNGGTVNISNAQISNNFTYGIYQASGVSTITSTEFSNQGYGLYVANGTATVSQSYFHDNTSYGLYNAIANFLNAENNYWGASSGPYHPTLNPSGIGNRVSDNVDFTPWLTQWPFDITPPIISAVSSSNITSYSATITWATDESSISQVEYGTTASYGSQTTLDPNLVTSHSMILSGLAPQVFYHYRVKSKDAAGNEAMSSDFTFTTSAHTSISGTISINTTWFANRVYVIYGAVTVSSGVTLTIEPGVVVKFQSTSSSLLVNGTLQVNGFSTNKVYFTSIKDDTVGGDTNSDGSASLPAAQNWQYIQFTSGSIGNIFNAVIRYAGYIYGEGIYNNGGTLVISDSQIADNFAYGVFQDRGTLTVMNSIINDHSYYGVDVVSTPGPNTLTLINNTFSNNFLAAARIYSTGNFTHSGNTATGTGKRGFLMSGTGPNQTWTAGDLPYIINGFNVYSTLTIEPGVVVKFDINTPSYLAINGTLQVNGTLTNKVYFTSIKDDSVGGDTNGDGIATSPTVRDWNQIQFNPGSIGNISNAVIRYGGNSSCCPVGAVLYNYGGTLNVSNSQFAYNSFIGIYQYFVGTLSITSSEFNNQNYGVRIDGGTATVSQSYFHDNASYGLYNATANLLNAENNYWGATSGPYHPTLNPSGTGNRVSDNVDFTPWLTQWP